MRNSFNPSSLTSSSNWEPNLDAIDPSLNFCLIKWYLSALLEDRKGVKGKREGMRNIKF